MSRNTRTRAKDTSWSPRRSAYSVQSYDFAEEQKLYQERRLRERAERRAAAKLTSSMGASGKTAESLNDLQVVRGKFRVARRLSESLPRRLVHFFANAAQDYSLSRHVAVPSLTVFDNSQLRMRHQIAPALLELSAVEAREVLTNEVPSLTLPREVAVNGLHIYGKRSQPFLALEVASAGLLEEAAQVVDALPIMRSARTIDTLTPHVSFYRPIDYETAQTLCGLKANLPRTLWLNPALVSVDPMHPLGANFD